MDSSLLIKVKRYSKLYVTIPAVFALLLSFSSLATGNEIRTLADLVEFKLAFWASVNNDSVRLKPLFYEILKQIKLKASGSDEAEESEGAEVAEGDWSITCFGQQYTIIHESPAYQFIHQQLTTPFIPTQLIPGGQFMVTPGMSFYPPAAPFGQAAAFSPPS